MNKVTKTIIGILLLTMVFVFSCQKKQEDSKETVLKGKATLYVDESILPIIEDEVAVFETQYDAKLHLVSKSENEIVNAMLSDTAKIAVLTRMLTEAELTTLKSKKIYPKTTPFATDAVAFIKNKQTNDTLVDINDIINFIKGEAVTTIKGLVFDNVNSSTARYISEVAGVTIGNQENVFSFKTNEEVIKYVSENKGLIGVVGINWIFQPPLELQQTVDKVNVMSVKGIKSQEYVLPTQDNLASGKYPLARHLYIINCQGYSGLGMGFASFLGGERGQRIILKSGLVPERVPTRKIMIRDKVSKEKN
jgi:phosphate transport system substrate-binding protein